MDLKRLETIDDTLERIATTSGLNAVDALACAFRRTLDVASAEFRRRVPPPIPPR
jgi:hypothetical protein